MLQISKLTLKIVPNNLEKLGRSLDLIRQSHNAKSRTSIYVMISEGLSGEELNSALE